MNATNNKPQNELVPIITAINAICSKTLPEYRSKEAPPAFPFEILKELWALGLAGMSIPASHQGTELGYNNSAEIIRSLSNHDLGLAIVVAVHNMCAGIISNFANEDQKQNLLTKLSTGELLAAFALTEPQAGSDARNINSSFKTTADGFILSGQKCYISSAGFADLYLVFAKAEGTQDIACFLVNKDIAGITFGKPEKKMAAELSPIASIFFDQVKLPTEALLGKVGEGYGIALSALAGGRLNIAAAAIGIAEAAIVMAAKHLQQREQFGHKLAEFQGLQFMLADMDIKLRASLALTKEAGFALDRKAPVDEQNYRAALAKCYATDSAMNITTDAVQLLGGAGYIAEYQVERLMREAKMLQIVEGTNQIQRLIIARYLLALTSRI